MAGISLIAGTEALSDTPVSWTTIIVAGSMLFLVAMLPLYRFLNYGLQEELSGTLVVKKKRSVWHPEETSAMSDGSGVHPTEGYRTYVLEIEADDAWKTELSVNIKTFDGAVEGKKLPYSYKIGRLNAKRLLLSIEF